MGDSIIPCGEVGSAHAMKALNNYVYAAGLRAVAEAVLIAEKSGLAPMTIKSLHRSGEKPKTQMGAALRASRGGRYP